MGTTLVTAATSLAHADGSSQAMPYPLTGADLAVIFNGT